MRKIFVFFSLLLPTFLLAVDFQNPSLNPSFDLFGQKEPEDVMINNRIILKIGGQAITVMDVVKKMDLLMYQRFPDFASSATARYQFYLVNWESMLKACIDDQLILADAEEKKIEVSDGDIREELESLFGPEVVFNIEKIGFTFDEIWEMLKTDLVVRRMTGMMVRSRAVQEVSPQNVRAAYEALVQKNPPQDIWKYRVLSLRSEDKEKNSKVAEAALELLEKQEIPFENISDALVQQGMIDDSLQVKVSDVYERSDKDMSLAHKAILQTLNVGAHSQVIAQNTKNGDEVLTRLFYLVGREMREASAFNEVELQLQNELIQKKILKFSEEYMDKLYRHFGMKETYLSKMMPDDFVPFTLR